ncbi:MULTISPECIES: sensor histidine kinase [Streptomycetaceae]|uniref:sensor histidine kinase n=1 Tax=Streptomycetaceae TaxID=2062 RepID=UPI0012FFA088|nr:MULTISPECIES: nitrate- and nitrite sensing domain-containing protein [Streptomycetaceae]MYS60997.1 HAMP domain-containing protein [Streptomyces sp. SID5468]
MLVSVTAVLAAGAPGVAGGVADVSESQRLLRLSQLNTAAIALSHSLADERADMAAYVATGRGARKPPAAAHGNTVGRGVSEEERARVDRQTAEVTADAAVLDTGDSTDLIRVTGDLSSALASLPKVRQGALAGPGDAKAAFDAYTPLIDALDAVGGALARALPSRASDADTAAGPALATAVEDASATRGQLVAALTAGGTSAALAGGAQQSRTGELAALADFNAAATQQARTRYAQTVTGADVATAESYLHRLTAKGYLTAADNRLRTADVDAALAARVDRMRAVQSSLAGADTTRLTRLRDDDVTALEIHAAVVACCALIALGLGVRTARSLTRPLGRLLRFATAHADGDRTVTVPVDSHDEFAAVARAVDRISAEAAGLRTEAAEREQERERLSAAREKAVAERAQLRRRFAAERDQLEQRLTAERDELRQRLTTERDDLLLQLHATRQEARDRQGGLEAEKQALTARLVALENTARTTYVSLSLRTLALVERQLALIEGLEEREQDPDQLQTLFRLDHLATRMRRNSESLLVLAGAETGGGAQARPVPLLDVVRAAVSEIERYERVRIASLPRTRLAGFAADDTSHVLAELLENATAFSPPDADVRISGWLLENGEVMLSIEDTGIGMPQARLAEANALLADAHPDDSAVTGGLGLHLVARMAGRHGVRVQLREHKQGGVTAVIVLPHALLARPDDDGRGEQRHDTAELTDVTPQLPEPRRAVAPEPPAEHARPQEAPVPADAAEAPRTTGKGLPKRVPRSSGLSGEPAARLGGGPVDADALRRRLGGFAQGLQAGRRDAEAEAKTSEPSEEARG